MKKTLKIILILLILEKTLQKNFAIILNNSKYYYNYRMATNVSAIYNSLKKLGYTSQNMLLLSNQATFNHPANFPANTQRLHDDNIKQNLITENFQIDSFYDDVTLKKHTMAFSGRYEQFDTLNKRMDLEGVDNLLIYLTGHGGDLYMKVLYLEIMFARHFSDFFEELFAGGKIKKALVLSDTCSASTLFNTTSGDDVNAVLFGSSEWDDYALSTGFDSYIGQPLKDRFSFAFVKLLDEIFKKDRKLSFEDFIAEFPKKKIESSSFFFNWMKKKKKDINMNDFLISKGTDVEVLEFEHDIEGISELLY